MNSLSEFQNPQLKKARSVQQGRITWKYKAHSIIYRGVSGNHGNFHADYEQVAHQIKETDSVYFFLPLVSKAASKKLRSWAGFFFGTTGAAGLASTSAAADGTAATAASFSGSTIAMVGSKCPGKQIAKVDVGCLES